MTWSGVFSGSSALIPIGNRLIYENISLVGGVDALGALFGFDDLPGLGVQCGVMGDRFDLFGVGLAAFRFQRTQTLRRYAHSVRIALIRPCRLSRLPPLARRQPGYGPRAGPLTDSCPVLSRPSAVPDRPTWRLMRLPIERGFEASVAPRLASA